MTELTGMDIAQIGDLARKMVAEAVVLELMLPPLTQKLESAPWVGPDRDAFVDEWKSVHFGPLNELIASLRDAAAKAKHHLEEQQRASNPY